MVVRDGGRHSLRGNCVGRWSVAEHLTQDRCVLLPPLPTHPASKTSVKRMRPVSKSGLASKQPKVYMGAHQSIREQHPIGVPQCCLEEAEIAFAILVFDKPAMVHNA